MSLLRFAVVEGNIDRALGQRLGAAGIAYQRGEIRMLAAIDIDRMDRAHAFGGEFGDFRFILLLLGRDFGLRFGVALERRAGGGRRRNATHRREPH